jgi:hypothetical protein
MDCIKLGDVDGVSTAEVYQEIRGRGTARYGAEWCKEEDHIEFCEVYVATVPPGVKVK